MVVILMPTPFECFQYSNKNALGLLVVSLSHPKTRQLPTCTCRARCSWGRLLERESRCEFRVWQCPSYGKISTEQALGKFSVDIYFVLFRELVLCKTKPQHSFTVDDA